MVEQDVIMALANHCDHIQRYELMLPNVFIQHDNESDLFGIRRSGLCDEFEVKVSRADFLADKKKTVRTRRATREEWLEFGWDDHRNKPGCKSKYDALVDGDMCINYFWYAVPEVIVTVDDVPDFAGLIVVRDDGRIRVKKSPKKLHKNKMSVEDRYKIARKSAYRFWKLKNQALYGAAMDKGVV
jgi:hypothetical protein